MTTKKSKYLAAKQLADSEFESDILSAAPPAWKRLVSLGLGSIDADDISTLEDQKFVGGDRIPGQYMAPDRGRGRPKGKVYLNRNYKDNKNYKDAMRTLSHEFSHAGLGGLPLPAGQHHPLMAAVLGSEEELLRNLPPGWRKQYPELMGKEDARGHLTSLLDALPSRYKAELLEFSELPYFGIKGLVPPEEETIDKFRKAFKGRK